MEKILVSMTAMQVCFCVILCNQDIYHSIGHIGGKYLLCQYDVIPFGFCGVYKVFLIIG